MKNSPFLPSLVILVGVISSRHAAITVVRVNKVRLVSFMHHDRAPTPQWL